MAKEDFEWHEAKNLENIENHGVSFYEAQHAFLDENRIIAEGLADSQEELRYFCFGLNKAKTGILTVRFTHRSGRIKK